MYDDSVAPFCSSSRRQSIHDFPSSSSERPLSFVYSSASQLRIAVLDHLKDLEAKLSQLDPHLAEESGGRSPVENATTTDMLDQSGAPEIRHRRRGSLSASAIQETREKIQHVRDMLRRIRSDVYSYLPDLPSLHDMRSHIYDGMQSSQESDIRLPHEEVLEQPVPEQTTDASYLHTLKTRLDSLNEHVHSLKLPPSSARRLPSLTVHPSSEIVAAVTHKLEDPSTLTNSLRTPLDIIGTLGKGHPSPIEAIKLEGQFDMEVARALKESDNGRRLITWEFVPHRYRNNRYVRSGYRFIPLSAWPRLLLSVFQIHSETANIMTHLIPLLYSLRAILVSLPPFPHFLQSVSTNLAMVESAEDIINSFDIPKHAFVIAANFCLLSSCIWHTMNGCSDLRVSELAAKIDYLGIGWLITMSSLTLVYYGFSCEPTTAYVYILLVICQGIAASTLPFKSSFDGPGNKNGRILFFVSLALGDIIPLVHLIFIHSFHDIYLFFLPTTHSLLSYIIGLIIYSKNIPERFVSDKWRWCSDLLGGGSHAIWHICIVFAIHFHAQAIVTYQNGIGNQPICELPWYWW